MRVPHVSGTAEHAATEWLIASLEDQDICRPL